MPTARGFRPVNHDYSLIYRDAPFGEAPGLITGPPVASIAEPFVVFANPWQAARHEAFWSPSVNPFRLLLVEYDDGDVLAETHTTTPELALSGDPVELIAGVWSYSKTGNPMFSKMSRRISSGTIVDELSHHEFCAFDTLGTEAFLSATLDVLSAHGWSDWTPALVA